MAVLDAHGRCSVCHSWTITTFVVLGRRPLCLLPLWPDESQCCNFSKVFQWNFGEMWGRRMADHGQVSVLSKKCVIARCVWFLKQNSTLTLHGPKPSSGSHSNHNPVCAWVLGISDLLAVLYRYSFSSKNSRRNATQQPSPVSGYKKKITRETHNHE